MTSDPMRAAARQAAQRDDAWKSPRGGLDGEGAAGAVHDAIDTSAAGAASSGKGDDLTAVQRGAAFTPEQEARLRQIIREECVSLLTDRESRRVTR